MSFNSREYEWADITVVAGGRDLTGIRSVKFERSRELEGVYAKGKDPHSLQAGNNSYKVEIGMLQSEFDALESASNNDIFELNVDINISFGNPSRGDVIKTHRVLGFRVDKDTFEMKQGDKMAEVTMAGQALKILKNV